MKLKISYEDVLLTAYGNIEKIICEMDKTVMRRCLNSFYSRNDALGEIEGICSIIFAKNKLVKLKNILDTVFSRMDKSEMELFEYKYFGIKKDNNFDYFSRNYFRKQIRAKKHFCELIGYIGLTEKAFLAEYSFIPYVRASAVKCTNRSNKIVYNFNLKMAS